MIAFLHGRLDEKHPTRVVLDVAGVGYELSIPLSSYDRLPEVGQQARVLTHLVVRDDAHLLYGFTREEERAMFLKLIGVNGVGPRIALATLSGLSPQELVRAIVEKDTKRLTGVPGVGKKMAERLCVELRDKIGQAEAIEAGGGAPDVPQLRDAALALLGLGYSQAEASKRVGAVAKASDTSAMTVEDILRAALN